MRDIWAMIEWEYDSFLEDCSDFGPYPDITDDIDAYARTRQPLADFEIRAKARTINYINLSYLLEGIARQLYTSTIRKCNRIFPLPFAKPLDELKQRENEMEILKKFRDKLSAHTAYAAPRTDDSLGQQISSLLHIGGGGAFINKELSSFHIGHFQVNTTEDKEKSFFLENSIGIYEQHQKNLAHFAQWKRMFITMLTHYRVQCPYTYQEPSVVYKLTAR